MSRCINCIGGFCSNRCDMEIHFVGDYQVSECGILWQVLGEVYRVLSTNRSRKIMKNKLERDLYQYDIEVVDFTLSTLGYVLLMRQGGEEAKLIIPLGAYNYQSLLGEVLKQMGIEA